MRAPILILLSLTLAAPSAPIVKVGYSISPNKVVSDWDALVTRYFAEAKQGRFDREQFLAEARPVVDELHDLNRAGRLDDVDWTCARHFESHGYYCGPTPACNKLHFAWGLFLEEIEETRILQYEVAPEFPPLSPKPEPAPQPAPVPET